MRLSDWFLTTEERDNPHSVIDARGASKAAWTEGNHVSLLIHGEAYFSRLLEELSALVQGDQVCIFDWRSDGDERLSSGGPTLRSSVIDACGRGVDVRGLIWRSHSDRFAFSAKQNRRFAVEVARAGGQALLDERVRRSGSHHQKAVILRHPSSAGRDIAFVGGIDLCHGRRDNERHHGDDQAITLDERYGARPPWHDLQLEVRGPAITDLDVTFRERWQDPAPLNHAGLARSWATRVLARSRIAGELPCALAGPPVCGGHAVQVLRTYPARRPRYPFAPSGERSIARAFAKAVRRARRLIYIEDQYFWSIEVAEILAHALRQQPELQLIIVVPRFPDKDGRLSGPPSRLAQARSLAVVKAAGGSRVGVYDVQNEQGIPIYVHAKVCVIDDVWVTVGSDNFNRRSWTHDSELSCAVIDSEIDLREPRDPAGLGDGSRKFARDLRLSLWAEHLGYSRDDPALLALTGATQLWEAAARTRDSGTQTDDGAYRSSARVRAHVVAPVAHAARPWACVVYRTIFDPDGRPIAMRLKRRF
ncbi:MAG: phospholipase [Acidobacteria bacterium]|nr:phospholipase [Acidobacteriota bacterium]